MIQDRSNQVSLEAMRILQIPPQLLRPAPTNPRTHSPRQIRQIADSIRVFGFTNPVLVDAAGCIIAGHGRVEAAKLLGRDTVPTICLSHLGPAEIRAYIIADNRLAELAGWDHDLLAVEFAYLEALDLDFDLAVTGFEAPEIEIILEEAAATPREDPADLSPPPGPAIARPGDLWSLGQHRLLCADAREAVSYTRLLGGRKAGLIFTDPPYNVPIDGHVCGLGAVRHGEFAMASGEMTKAGFTAFLETVFRHLADHSADGSIHFACMDWRHLGEALAAGNAVYEELKNLCVWVKDNGGMGSLYRSQHELVLVFKHGTGTHTNNVQLGRFGRNRTNVWTYPGVNGFRRGQAEERKMHPTVKPVALVADAIRDCLSRGDIVLDAFAGSGTTLIAAEKTGRMGYGLEIEPGYVDVAIRRWQALTGKSAVREDGCSFAELETAMAEAGHV